MTDREHERGDVGARLALLDEPVVPEGRVSRHALLQLETGEVEGEARAVIEAAVAASPEDQARLQDLAAERDAFFARRPVAAFEAAIAARQRPTVWARIRAWIGGPTGFSGLAVAAAAALVLAVTPRIEGPARRGTTLKGGVELTFHVKAGDEVIDGVPGGIYHPDDRIQLRYSTPSHRYLIVVSIDGRGAVTPFYDDDGRSLAIEPGVRRLLERSVVLDDALGPERIIGCFSREGLDTDEVVAAAEEALEDAGGEPSDVETLDIDCHQRTFLIEKRPREEGEPE